MARHAKVPRDRSEAELPAPPHELLGEEGGALAALEVLGSISAVGAKGRQTLLGGGVVAAAGRVALQVLDGLGDEALHGVRVVRLVVARWRGAGASTAPRAPRSHRPPFARGRRPPRRRRP